jgi:membrane-associated phospholipid phosphatase
MAMASAFAGVWIRLYPKTALAFFGLTSLGMIVLVMGDWHFLSDVIAGTVLGTTVGLITGELWLQHNASHRTAGKPARTA